MQKELIKFEKYSSIRGQNKIARMAGHGSARELVAQCQCAWIDPPTAGFIRFAGALDAIPTSAFDTAIDGSLRTVSAPAAKPRDHGSIRTTDRLERDKEFVGVLDDPRTRRHPSAPDHSSRGGASRVSM